MPVIKRKSRPPAGPKSAGVPLIAYGPPLFGPPNAPRVRVFARDANGRPTLQGVAYPIAGDDDG